MAELLDGRKVAELVKESIAAEVRGLPRAPVLAVLMVGDNPASQVYVSNKVKACQDVGISSRRFHLPASTPEEKVLEMIDSLNEDPEVDGILVQLPLPHHVDRERVLERVDPGKDVDGFHPYNVGKLMQGRPTVEPCTPKGIMKLLEHYGVELEGKEAVIVGRSEIVGKPMALMMLHRNATVSILHSKTKDLAEHTRRAEILVVATGRPGFVTADMVGEGAVVVDVGINRLPNGKIVGDVDFEEVAKKASWITPVPGGVGPMTVAMLLQNTLERAKAKLLEGGRT